MYECAECGEKVRGVRNCDGTDGKPKCPSCGVIDEDEIYTDKAGSELCSRCSSRVKYHYSLSLGGKFIVHQCPVMLINQEALFLIEMVNACADLHTLPEPTVAVYDQSALFMEARKIVLSEQHKAYDEIKPKEDSAAKHGKR